MKRYQNENCVSSSGVGFIFLFHTYCCSWLLCNARIKLLDDEYTYFPLVSLFCRKQETSNGLSKQPLGEEEEESSGNSIKV